MIERLKEAAKEQQELYDIGVIGVYNWGIQTTSEFFLELIKDDYKVEEMEGIKEYPYKLSKKIDNLVIFTVLSEEKYEKIKQEEVAK